ncbi:MAG: ribosome biogenesis GTPase YlqF [Clostridia bacterium]|nr:ribosome biogenesis GTPase YlqF [Clostridia bacterium]
MEKSNNNEKLTKVGINWYPGHMAKAKKQIAEDIKLVDIVIEILDSRIPLSSQNPDIAKVIQGKKKIIVLNKCDISDEKQNKLWVKYFENKGIPAVLTDSNSGKGIEDVIRQIEKIMAEELEKKAVKGRVGSKIKAMIIGIPNVGKSSFINRIAKKNSANVGNKPGVTKTKQWIRINEKIELLDTPGVLWPKFENNEIALNLAFTGTIKDEILENVEIAYYLIRFLINNYRKNLCERYKIEESYIENILSQDQMENENIYEIMLEIGRKRGAIVSGGNIDEEKTSRIIIDDFRNQKLGKITLELCKE